MLYEMMRFIEDLFTFHWHIFIFQDYGPDQNPSLELFVAYLGRRIGSDAQRLQKKAKTYILWVWCTLAIHNKKTTSEPKIMCVLFLMPCHFRRPYGMFQTLIGVLWTPLSIVFNYYMFVLAECFGNSCLYLPDHWINGDWCISSLKLLWLQLSENGDKSS